MDERFWIHRYLLTDNAWSPPESAPGAHSQQAITATIVLAVLGIFVSYFPINAVAGSLSDIAAATGADTAELQWIPTAYSVPMTAAVLSAGVFGDVYGRRRIYLIGILFTGLGAGTAAVADLTGSLALPFLLTGQVIAGLGGGLLLPTTLALIAVAVPDPRRRGRYIAMWATSTGASLAISPITSGLILEIAHWGWVFVPSLVLAVAAGAIAYAKLPESKSLGKRSLDIPGQITVSVAILALTFGVIEGGKNGWAAPTTVSALVIAIIALSAFILVERRAAEPLLHLALFKIPSFSAANFGSLMALFSIVGVVFLISIYLGATQKLGALEIGARIMFVPGISALVNPIIGRFIGRMQPMYLLSSGLVVGAVGTLAISGVTADSGFLDLVWRLSIFGVANAMMLTAVSVAAINATPPPLASMAAAANTAIRQLGAALGPAVLGTIYAVAVAASIAGGGAGATAGEAATAGLRTAMLTTSALLFLAGVVCIVSFAVDARRPRMNSQTGAKYEPA